MLSPLLVLSSNDTLPALSAVKLMPYQAKAALPAIGLKTCSHEDVGPKPPKLLNNPYSSTVASLTLVPLAKLTRMEKLSAAVERCDPLTYARKLTTSPAEKLYDSFDLSAPGPDEPSRSTHMPLHEMPYWPLRTTSTWPATFQLAKAL